MKRRYIIVICFACLIIFACLVSQFTVSQIQTDNALKYEEVNKISPLNISKKTLTVSQKLKLYIDSTNDTSDTSNVHGAAGANMTLANVRHTITNNKTCI